MEADLKRFKRLVATSYADGTFFQSSREIFYARVPGRLDLMGGIADYSGSLVLEMPIAEAVMAAVQPVPEREITIMSLSGGRERFSMPLSDFGELGSPITYAEAFHYFKETNDWAAYIAGAFLVLMRERGIRFNAGAKILIQSDVPEGKGVSSSAAVEAAAMLALGRAFGVEFDGVELATLCQIVENRVAGAPCGIMDQMTVVNGRENQLLALKCQPAEILGMVPLPPELAVWGLDSGIRHAVSGADYGSVRIGAFMGLKILQQTSGRSWDGYLANISPSLYEQRLRATLPDSMRGDHFLATYGAHADSITEIDRNRLYAVRRPTEHPIYENFRVESFGQLLDGPPDKNGPLLGELMFQSHASYSACGLGSEGTDLLVELVRSYGLENGLLGGKITGGGSGGTVAILGWADAESAVRDIAERYYSETGHFPYIFKGSSAGALASSA